MARALIIFIKNAEVGKVKTRLASTIGVEKAYLVYKSLLAYTISITKNVTSDRFVFYDSFIEEADDWDKTYFSKKIQSGDDLGERMFNSSNELFIAGYQNIVVIGSDCPAITAQIIENAFAELENSDVVIGPATDGGYYLLGLKKRCPELFEKINWSTNKVLGQTLEICQRLDLSAYLLPELSDIDDENDLQRSDFFAGNK